jgi:hypothetical protein
VAGGPAFAVRAPQSIPSSAAERRRSPPAVTRGLEVSLRLELVYSDTFRAVVPLRSLADPTVLADAPDLWSGRSTAPELFGPRGQ